MCEFEFPNSDFRLQQDLVQNVKLGAIFWNILVLLSSKDKLSFHLIPIISANLALVFETELPPPARNLPLLVARQSQAPRTGRLLCPLAAAAIVRARALSDSENIWVQAFFKFAGYLRKW